MSFGAPVVFAFFGHAIDVDLSGLSPVMTALSIAVASAFALRLHRDETGVCKVGGGSIGLAFLCGAGIYCGAFALTANYAYRLIFLLLCVPQIAGWLHGSSTDGMTRRIAGFLLAVILIAVWFVAIPVFLLVPQLATWLLFMGLFVVLMLNALQTMTAQARAQLSGAS
jgi:hypothetical protein